MTQFILNSDVKEIRDVEERVRCLAAFFSSYGWPVLVFAVAYSSMSHARSK
jgi:hypothetical protein